MRIRSREPGLESEARRNKVILSSVIERRAKMNMEVANRKPLFSYIVLIIMEKETITPKFANSKGAAIFKKMLEDKKAISKHIEEGGKLSDLKGKLNLPK